MSNDKICILYHGTSLNNISSILKSGLSASDSGLLGSGVYVNKDFDKCKNYPTDLSNN